MPDTSLFVGPTIDVARRLIGAHLIRAIPPDMEDAGATLVGRIVETEAYLPLVDPACHGFRGPTPRNSSIFGRPGHAYVYFVYGNHYCFNVTTEAPGIGGAVLIRALEPIAGIELMRSRRPGVPDQKLLSGPGNLCRAMSIDRSFDGADLSANPFIRVTRTGDPAPDVASSPRVGIRMATDWPLRFYERSNPCVSRQIR